MDNNQIKNELKMFIDSLTVKKQKSTGKKYFFDKDEYLVLDIVVKSKLVFTHKSCFLMLKDLPDSEAVNLVKETLNDLGFEAEGVSFLDDSYPSEKLMFESFGFTDAEKKFSFKLYQINKNRDKLVIIKN